MTNRTLPHLPSLCYACFLLCVPHEQAVALTIRRMIVGLPLNEQWFYLPAREPLCGQPAMLPFPAVQQAVTGGT